jgi:hypothetical protein
MPPKRSVYFLQNGPRLATKIELAAYDSSSTAYTRVESFEIPLDTNVVFMEIVVLNDGEPALGATPEDRMICVFSHEALHVWANLWDVDTRRRDGKDFFDTVTESQRFQYRSLSSDGITSDLAPRVRFKLGMRRSTVANWCGA